MSTKTEPKRVPLLKYWTIRYLLVLLSSLIIVASLAVYWTQEREKKYNLQLNRLFAQEMAERIGSEGELVISSAMWNRLLSRGRSYFAGDEQAQKPLPLILIVDREGKVIFQNRTIRDERLLRYLMEKGSAAEEVMDTLDAGERAWYIVAEPIWRGDWLIGSVFVISEKSVRFSMPLRQVFPWVIVILCLGLSGWMVLYWLSRKLTDPIRRVAAAASQLRQGQYQVELPRDLREQELYELTHSFSEMASRLKRLEELRTELLAGVTHELKTPITSIGGLLRAIRDRVVTGEEAEEFLEISLGETQRLQKMVEDLLEFNAYATGAVSIRAEVLSLDGLVREMADRWKVMNPHPAIRLQTTLPEEMMRVRGDAHRIQQILFNLLENSQSVLKDQGSIHIRVYPWDAERAAVDVTDDGPGIPPEEQALVFERFYRGKKKQEKTRGMGLGLPISRLLARAQKGDLFLKESVPGRTTFTLLLPRARGHARGENASGGSA